MIHMTCNFCDGAECDDIKATNYTKEAYSLQDINKHGATLTYECSLGKEFYLGETLDANNETVPDTTPNMTLACTWGSAGINNGVWDPSPPLHNCTCNLLQKNYFF